MFRPTTVDGAVAAVSKSLRHLKHVVDHHARESSAKSNEAIALRVRADVASDRASEHYAEMGRAQRIHGKLSELVA